VADVAGVGRGLDPDVEAVLLAGVEVVEPCGEELGGAELAAVVVLDDVVGVVWARVLVAKGAQGAAGQKEAGGGAVAAVRLDGGEGEGGRDVFAGERGLLAKGALGCRAVADGEGGGVEGDDAVAGGEVAGGPGEAGADDVGGGGALGLVGGVELEQEAAAGGVADDEAGVGAVGLGAGDGPGGGGVERRGVAGAGGAGGGGVGGGAVFVPARVGDLVERVDVDGLAGGVDGEEARDRAQEDLIGAVAVEA
jgi:hypothetical protein